MSRQSDAKKARRRKRMAARGTNWIPEPIFEEIRAAAESDPVAEALAGIDEWICARGWVLDPQNSEDLVTWVFPPSATDFPDEDREPITRIWITVAEDDEEVVLEFGATLVGDDGGDDAYVLDPDSLDDDVAALEAYRPGLSRPELD